MLELLAHAPDRATLWQSMSDAGFVTFYDGNNEATPLYRGYVKIHPKEGTIADQPIPGMHELDHTPMIGWVELGDLVKTPAVYDENDTLITPAEYYGLYFVNFRGWGTFERSMLAGNEQYDSEGNLKWIFDRTNLLYQYPTLIQYELDTTGGTPRGYKNDAGVCFYDAADISNRYNVWA